MNRLRKRLALLLCACMLILTGCTKTSDKYLENYQLGTKYLSSGEYDKAIIAFYNAIEIDDKQIEPYAYLLMIFVDTEQEEKAGKIANLIKEKFSEEDIVDYFSGNEENSRYLDVLIGDKYVDKINNDVEWIVQADYYLPVDKSVYYAYGDHSRPIYADELTVPFININSDDANKANEEIYSVYQNLVETYNDNIRQFDEIWFTVVEYNVSIADSYASTIIKTTNGGTGEELYKYYVYTFDLKTGELLSCKDAIDIANIEDVESKVIDEIAIYLQSCCGGINDHYNGCYTKSIENFYNSIDDNSLKVFIDNNRELDVIVGVYNPFYWYFQDMFFHID